MKNFLKIFSIFLISGFVMVNFVFAQGITNNTTPNSGGSNSGGNTGTLSSPDSNSSAMVHLKKVAIEGYDVDHTNEHTMTQFIGLIISVFLGLLGVIFVILIIVAGYNWMTAGGNEEKVSKAGATIKVAIIGLLIVIGAFAIWKFVLEKIVAI